MVSLVWKTSSNDSTPTLIGVFPDRYAANNFLDAYVGFEEYELCRIVNSKGMVEYHNVPNNYYDTYFVETVAYGKV